MLARPLRGQAPQLAQRHRLPVGRHDLVQRPASTASTPTTKAASRRRSCRRRSIVSTRSDGSLHGHGRRFRGAERPCLLARRAPALRRGERAAVRGRSGPAHPRLRRVSTTASGSRRGESFTRSRPGSPTASASTRRATSGAAPPTACIASPGRRDARQDQGAVRRCRTSPSAAATGRGCSSAPRTRCSRSTPTSAAPNGHERASLRQRR